jgi:hypothetical protein
MMVQPGLYFLSNSVMLHLPTKGGVSITITIGDWFNTILIMAIFFDSP